MVLIMGFWPEFLLTRAGFNQIAPGNAGGGLKILGIIYLTP